MKGFNLGKAPMGEKLSAAAPETVNDNEAPALAGFSAEEAASLDAHVLNELSWWGGSFDMPVFRNLPPELAAKLKEAAAWKAEPSVRREAADLLDRYYDDYLDRAA